MLGKLSLHGKQETLKPLTNSRLIWSTVNVKITVIYNEPIGYAGTMLSRKLFVDVGSYTDTGTPSNEDIKLAVNGAGHKTQKPGHEWDIMDAVIFMFYGHIEDVR